MDAPRPQVLQGTLDAMILATLARAPAHGYAIARSIEHGSGGLLAIEEGSLYPALRRLRQRGDIDAEWQTTATGRRGKVYRLTADGRARLREERRLWAEYSAAVERVLSGRSLHPFDVDAVTD
ncbi:MAG: PadR family transcriptional regulator [Phycisphaerae bacterium]|nr:PadR family transcriptional regulator [Phycisphaerae bacterium]